MPKKCPRCGYIHWKEAPLLEETASWVIAESPVTTAEVAERFNITLQNANGRLTRLEDLDVLCSEKQPQESGGYINVYDIPPRMTDSDA